MSSENNERKEIVTAHSIELDTQAEKVNEPYTEPKEGMSSNLAGLLAYLFGFITGIIFLFVGRDDKFVRYHAWQSIIVFGTFFVLTMVFFILDIILISIPVIGWIFGVFSIIITIALAITHLVMWIYLMVQAYQGNKPSIIIAGNMARSLSDK